MRNPNPSLTARGLVLQYSPENPGDISRMGGTLTGTWGYDAAKGQRFDGSSYVTLKPHAQPFAGSGFWSAVIEFTPNFEANEAVSRRFFVGHNAAVLGVYVSRVSTGQLQVSSGGTTVLYIANASWAPYWRINQRNVLVVTVRNAVNTAYLNGTMIGSSVTASAVPTPIAALYIGSTETGALCFSGHIHSLKFFKHAAASELLTAQEAKDYYDRSTFRYQERATCILPFSAATHDATNNRTLDVSGKGANFTFGDGVTASTFPTKLATRGYTSDTGDWFDSGKTDQLIRYTTPFTICCLHDASSHILSNNYTIAADVDGIPSIGFVFMKYPTANGYSLIFSSGGINARSYFSMYYPYSLNFVAVTYDGLYGATSVSFFVNGKFVTPTHGTTGVPVNPTSAKPLLIGARHSGASKAQNMPGKFGYFALYPFALSRLQILNEYQVALSGINKV